MVTFSFHEVKMEISAKIIHNWTTNAIKSREL